LQKKYFGESDPSIPVFSFIGRIVVQKGVHLILHTAVDLITMAKGRIQIIVR
jgi:glycogen synthase